jgi:uncharacterized protein (TIGR03905 family)
VIHRFKTHSLVCSQAIQIEIDDATGLVKSVEFLGGCPGNLAGISRLAAGMSPEELINRLQGIKCGDKSTSCPDQLAHALKKLIASG